MPYGLVHKITENGFSMWSSSGLIECELSRRLRKSLPFKIHQNMVLTADIEDESDSDGNRNSDDAPKKVTYLDIHHKAVLLAVGDQTFIDNAKSEMKGHHIKVFTVLKKKKDHTPRACFVAKNGDIHDCDNFDVTSKRSLAKLWDRIRDLNASNGHSDDQVSQNDNNNNNNNKEIKLSAESLNEHQIMTLTERLRRQEESLVEMRNLLGIRIEANLNSGLGYIAGSKNQLAASSSSSAAQAFIAPSLLNLSAPAQQSSGSSSSSARSPPQIATPSAGLLALLDAHDERSRSAEAQIKMFDQDTMERLGIFQIADTDGNILRTLAQVKDCAHLRICSGGGNYSIRTIELRVQAAQVPASSS